MKAGKKYNYLNLMEDSYFTSFNNKPFTFRHSLQQCKLLSLEQLHEVISRIPQAHVMFSAGDNDIHGNLDTLHQDHKPKISLDNVFANLESSGAFVMVRQPDIDPVFKELFIDLMADVKQFANAVDPGLHGFMLYLFIASPGSVTPFHIDRYSTFLFQLQGHKDVSVWTPWDKGLVSDQELEQFFSFKERFAPSLKDGYMEKATVNHIHPGEAIHIPFVAPHWVHNSDEVSVSLSIIFNSRKTRNYGNALRFNNWYRNKFNRAADSVNHSKIKDYAKAGIYKNYELIRQTMNG